MGRFIRVTRGSVGNLNSEGLEPLRLALWDNGVEVDKIVAYSGAPGAQNFRTLVNEHRGVLEPIPEGKYTQIGDLEWKGGVDNYEDYWSSALGPVVAQIYGERAIMLHLDANRQYSPGSAGCLCPIDLSGLKRVVGWWKKGKPEWVECDWGLGTINKLQKEIVPVSKRRKIKFFKNKNGATAFFDDKEANISDLVISLNGNAMAAVTFELMLTYVEKI